VEKELLTLPQKKRQTDKITDNTMKERDKHLQNTSENQRLSHTNPTKKGSTHVLWKGKEFLLH
jgi:hypothetical protein